MSIFCIRFNLQGYNHRPTVGNFLIKAHKLFHFQPFRCHLLFFSILHQSVICKMLPKKHFSGSEKPKKRKRVDNLIESQKGAMDNFIIKRVDSSKNEEEKSEAVEVENVEQG